MIKRAARYLRSLARLQRINMSLTRGGLSRAGRTIDASDPASWEFSGFSQNGEDGVIDYLLNGVTRPNRYFLEIGASDGLENNTTWLAMTRRFSGMWIEGDPQTSSLCRELFGPFNHGVEAINSFVTRDNALNLLRGMSHTDPDVFSLDVDGTDYYLALALFANGFRPKICVVEYNSAFGPNEAITVPYDRALPNSGELRKLYYGCSISGWRTAFAGWGYEFVSVDTNGVNAFFVDPLQISPHLLRDCEGLLFAENYAQLREYKIPWHGQWERIRHLPFKEISSTTPSAPIRNK